MSLITWRDEFSVGVAAVDHEHREMIALINELDQAMQSDASQAAVVQALGEIYARISAHFALEERRCGRRATPTLRRTNRTTSSCSMNYSMSLIVLMTTGATIVRICRETSSGGFQTTSERTTQNCITS